MRKKTRMFTGDEPPADPIDEEAGTPSPRTTIVGGRPPEDDAKVPPVPTGIQRLLRLAAVDEAFRAQLIELRAEVAEAAGVELTPSEQAILGAISDGQLAQMAGQLPEPTPDRRSFLRKTAATAVVLLGGAALSDCDSCERSNQGGTPPPRPDHREMDTEGGAAPDEPPPRPDRPEMQIKGGAAPDRPPARPDHREMELTGGAAPDEPPPRPDRVPSPPGGARPDVPEPKPKPAPSPDGGAEDGFAEPPPDWDGEPIGGEQPPPRPVRPSPTKGIRPDPEDTPPSRPERPNATRGIRPSRPKKKN